MADHHPLVALHLWLQLEEEVKETFTVTRTPKWFIYVKKNKTKEAWDESLTPLCADSFL